jgi:hypothetical protein
LSKQKNLTGYALVAVEASKLAAAGVQPTAAWADRAAKVFAGKPASEVKGCPRSTFLGLAGAGLIVNVPPGAYTKSVENRRYGIAAMQRLVDDASWANRPMALWEAVASYPTPKRHNGQMQVVLALWNARLLAPSTDADK